MKDFEKVRACLFTDPKWSHCLTDKENIVWFDNMLQYLHEPQRRPDAIAYNNNDLLLIEHFEFDNSKISRKGSKQHTEDAKMQSDINSTPNNKPFALKTQTLKRTGVYYIENFSKQFENHYSKINEYKQIILSELNKTFTTIKTLFIIEDTSPLGTNYVKDFRPYALNLLRCKEFLDIFEKAQDLDFVLFKMTSNNNNKIIMFASKDSIEELRKDQIEVKEIDTFLFEDQYIFYC